MRFALILALLPLPALAGGIDMVSQVDGLTVKQLDKLPRNPAGRPDPESCTTLLTDLTTAEAKGVAALGWVVTGEAVRDELTFVSFAGKTEQGTSGSCFLSDGNVAVFRGGRLAGLVYAEAGAKRGIGAVDGSEAGIRVWDGDYPPRPLADLRELGGELVIVSPVALRDTLCKGAVSVPNLYGIPIHLARRLLLAEGWAPEPADAATTDEMEDWVHEMQATLPEVQGCGGTGFGWCDYAYTLNGAALSVSTSGDPELPDTPAVFDYGVTCP